MKLHFDSNQDCQLQAIQSIADVIEGQSLNTCEFEFSPGWTQTSLQPTEYSAGNAFRLIAGEVCNQVSERVERLAVT